MYTIDASVWVNGSDRREAGYRASRQLIDELDARALPIVLPTLALVEIAGTLSRTRADAMLGETLARTIAARPNITFVSLSRALALRAIRIAAQQRLRGADAIYAIVALRSGTTLVSRDHEHLTRLSGIVTVQTPEQVLASL